MANLKITELAALTTVLGEDLLAIVDDPTGTASTKKIRTDDFQSTWHVGARVYNSGNISVADSSAVALTFDSERYDTDGIHSTVLNTGRLTCQTAGKYLISGNVEFAANATGQRQLYIRLGGATIIGFTQPSVISAVTGRYQVSTIYDLAASNYVELVVNQSSSGSLNVTAAANWSPEFMMHRIG